MLLFVARFIHWKAAGFGPVEPLKHLLIYRYHRSFVVLVAV